MDAILYVTGKNNKVICMDLCKSTNKAGKHTKRALNRSCIIFQNDMQKDMTFRYAERRKHEALFSRRSEKASRDR